MIPLRNVALVGRPNVGKSRLFNRLVGKRLAIVHDQAGVTRDVMAEEVDEDFVLMDTGGIGMKDSDMSTTEINEATEEQVAFALNAAQLILFVVDAREGLTTQDTELAKYFRKSGKKILVVANKVDNPEQSHLKDAFYSLGFGDPLWVSAEHGHGAYFLLEKIAEVLGPKPVEEERDDVDRVRICFAGRPNVGKSSLTNRLLKSERMIVSDMPGTTRDAIQANLDYEFKGGKIGHYRLIDTAGLRAKGKVDNSVEFFSGIRTGKSIETADVVFLVIDALEGVAKQDKKLLDAALEAGRNLIVVVNKWDYARDRLSKGLLEDYETEAEFKKSYTEAIRKTLFGLPNSPILFASAKEGIGIEYLLKEADRVFEISKKKLQTSHINDVIHGLIQDNKPHVVHGKRFKVYYCTQAGDNPFKIKIFCNRAMRLEASYERYLRKGIFEAFELEGCPVQFELIGKPPRELPKK